MPEQSLKLTVLKWLEMQLETLPAKNIEWWVNASEKDRSEAWMHAFEALRAAREETE